MMSWAQFSIFLAVTILAVEGGLRLRWRSIEAMFDRALMHGGSLDTLSRALRENSEASSAKADQAFAMAEDAVEAVKLLKRKVDRLEEHPILRRIGGSGTGKIEHEP